MGVDRKAAAGVLREIAEMLELHGANPYRVRAYGNAARAVERVEGTLEELVASGEILEVKGIGRGTAGVLSELLEGRVPSALAELDDKTPAGVKELLGVPGLGPKKVRSLWRELELTSLGELEYACRENRLVELSGFGLKSQQRLLESLEFLQPSRDRRLVHQAWRTAEEVSGLLTGALQVELAGELRRGCETVGGLDLVAVGGGGPTVDELIQSHVEGLELEMDSVWSASTVDGSLLRVIEATRENVGAVLAWATGSAEHVATLQRRADSAGLRLERDGLWSGSQMVPCPDEESLYEALGCRWVPPELREDGSEVELAASSGIPDLLQADELRGVLHNHTVDSDGSASLEEMAAAAGRRRGWSFIGVADHSPAAHYANGLTADRLRDQWTRIDEANRDSQIRIIKGLEADILTDGRLDIPEGCEAGLEYVVASVHSAFSLPEEVQTERIVTAVRHPACRVLGHPTGRLLLARPGYAVDLERVLAECAEHGVAVEINASPYRLDLDSQWARRALELGITLAINPDAHSVEGLDDVRWGVSVARRAGATASHVLNCEDIEEWVRRG
jgi:DNA polymerase (family 10)